MGSSNIIGIPESDKAFEDRTAVLFAAYINDPNLKGVATRGKDQQGIDLIGARDGDPAQPVAIQCKLKTKGGSLSVAEAQADIERALTIEPPLREIYVVTTGADDLAYDKLTLTLRQEQLAMGRKVEIHVWGWDEMQRRIRRYPEALRAFDPNYSASTEDILSIGRETRDTARETAGKIDNVEVQQALLSTKVNDILALMSSADGRSGDAVDKLLDSQIDQIRELLNQGKPETALVLLKRLEGKLPLTASDAIRSRLQGNIGMAYLKKGEEAKAADALEEAYRLNPEDTKARANRLLALLLRGDHQSALEGAKELLAEDNSNAAAASYAYQAAAVSGSGEPDDFVPNELRSNENVAINRVNFLRLRHRSEWRGAAAALLDDHPESIVCRRIAAEALLDQAYETRAYDGHKGEGGSRRSALQKGVDLLQANWDEVRKYENAADEVWLSVGVNLVTAYRALGDLQRASIVSGQTLALAPENADALIAAAHLDILSDDHEAALKKMSGVPDGPMRTLVTAMAFAQAEDWRSLDALLTAEACAAVRELDRKILDSLRLRARFHLGTAKDAGRELEALIDAWPDDLTVVIQAAELARYHHPEAACALLDRAVVLLDDSSGFTDRVMLAQLALQSDDYETAITALDGYVDTTTPNEALAWLSLAFANAPTRPRTHQFFESLPRSVVELPRFARLGGSAEYGRGDLGTAERHLRAALHGDPADLRAQLMLHSLLVRADRRDEAAQLIKAVDESAVKASPLEKMQLASLLRHHGEESRAVAIGYEVASQNRDDEKIVSMYPPLLLFAEDLPKEVARGGTAEIGYWFELEGVDVPGASGLIQDRQTPGVLSYPPDQPLAQAVMGHSAGDEIVLPQGIGEDRRYRIKAVKHPFLWLLDDIMETQATRFPSSTLMGSLTMRDGDIQPVLDLVRRLEDHNQSILELYNEEALPLEVLAAINKKSVITVAELIRHLGGIIRTCVGSEEERIEAQTSAKRAAGKGAVLDTFTGWYAYHAGLLPVLEDHFGFLVIAQSTIDDLLNARGREELNAGKEYLTLGFEGDQATRQVHTSDDTDRRITLMDEAIAALRRHCRILPVDGSEDLALAQLMHRQEIEHMLDPVYLSKQHTLFLLSDDLHLRQIASIYGSGRGGWLQAVAQVLKAEGKMSPQDYALCVGRLAAWKHDHVSLDGSTLVDLVSLDREHADAYFDVAADFIGGPKAEILSNAAAVADFMNHVWAARIPSWRKGRAAGRLLERLILRRGEGWWETVRLLARIIPTVRRDIAARPDLSQNYLREWLQGHFLRPPAEPVKRGHSKRQKNR